MLFVMAAAVACGGGEEEKCDLRAELATQNAGSVPVVSLEEARRRADFDIVLPADLPAGAMVSGVTLSLVPCTNKVHFVEIPIHGPGWILTLDQSAGDKPAVFPSSSPIRINDVDGKIRRNTAGSVVSVTWTDGERSYVAAALLRGGLTEALLLQILESIPE